MLSTHSAECRRTTFEAIAHRRRKPSTQQACGRQSPRTIQNFHANVRYYVDA
jgi:hypothetical protein